MAVAMKKFLNWSGIQGILVTAAVFLIGTPAGFSICGLSWRFPWLEEDNAPARQRVVEVSSAPAPSAEYAPTIAPKPQPLVLAPTVECIATSQASVVFCVTVKNRLDRSLHLRSGHVNLSEVGMAQTPWPAMILATWQPARLPLAKVLITADRELPGTPHGFQLGLTVPPGHERRFLLQVDALNLPVRQDNRFFAVGTLVLEDGSTELTSAEFDLFGQRLAQADSRSVSPLAEAPDQPPTLPAPPTFSPLQPNIAVDRPAADVGTAQAGGPQQAESPGLVQKVGGQLNKMATGVAEWRHKIPLPSLTGHSAPPPPTVEVSPPAATGTRWPSGN